MTTTTRIIIEGCPKSGKTTLAALVTRYLRKHGMRVAVKATSSSSEIVNRLEHLDDKQYRRAKFVGMNHANILVEVETRQAPRSEI